jgi:hypothetical protein
VLWAEVRIGTKVNESYTFLLGINNTTGHGGMNEGTLHYVY